MRQSVRIVQSLQRSLAARAQSALPDRIGGIALELDDAPFTDSRDHAASGRAFCAGRRKEARYSRHYVFIGHDIRNQLARRRLAAAASLINDRLEIGVDGLSRSSFFTLLTQ